jgi:hypothetical protein
MISPAIWNLVATVFGGDAGFEKTGANGVERGELLAIVKKGRAAFDNRPPRNEFVDPDEFLQGQPDRHA